MGKKKPLWTLSGNVNCFSHYTKQYEGSSKKIKIQLLHDPAISLLGIHPKGLKSGSQGDICSFMLITVLFTIAKLWKQHKCSSTEEWIMKMCYTHAMEYYSLLIKGNPALCNSMYEPGRHYAK